MLLVDMPPGTGDATLSLLELPPDTPLLAVTTPTGHGTGGGGQDGAHSRRKRRALAGVIESVAPVCTVCGGHSAVFGSGGGGILAAETGAPLLGQVPLDVAAREAGDAGEPVVIAQPMPRRPASWSGPRTPCPSPGARWSAERFRSRW